MPQVPAVPQGFHTLTPHLTVRNAARAIQFYRQTFGAQIIAISPGPGDRIMHASLKIGDSVLMLNDEFPEWGTLSPLSTGSSGVTIRAYLRDVDAAYGRAISAGATAKMPPMDAFWGDRYGLATDPFGHRWAIATHLRDLSPEEIHNAQQATSWSTPKSSTLSQ